jgi:hypothetical protein
LVSIGEVGFDGGEVAMLSRSSRAASALGRVLALGVPYEKSVGGCVPESIHRRVVFLLAASRSAGAAAGSAVVATTD